MTLKQYRPPGSLISVPGTANRSKLGSALSAALAASGPTLLEVMVDPAAFPPFTKWDNSPALAQPASVGEPAR
jgi:thiamine pyrophosphate-dependent acetolactate synthase large subunit-like protein